MENISKRTWKIIQRIATFLFTVLLFFFIAKFAVYFMPFLIAGIIAIMIEPLIKFCMNKLKMSRRVSSIIIVSLTIILICLLTYYGGAIAIKEVLKLTKNITPAISNVMTTTKELISKYKEENSTISPEVLSTLENSLMEFVSNVGTWIIDWVSGLTKYILSLPYMIINIVITILALIFFTKDRIYIIDLAEHHMPKTWVKKISKVLTEFFKTLGGYIRVYAKIIIITFVELFLAFNIFNVIGFKVEYPFLLAIIIAFIDILPILGVGTVLNPWALWLLATGEYGYAAAVFITYIIIFAIRQVIEPRLVSKEFGVHPLITLFAMYAGFKAAGVFGLILGPIGLMILKCLFEPQLEKGLFKDLFDEE